MRKNIFDRAMLIISATVLLPGILMAQNGNLDSQTSENAYHLAPGDAVSIQVFGEEDLSREVKLGQDGKVNYAFVGQIELAGQTIDEVESTITGKLLGDYLINPQVSVTMAEYRPFFINGEVNDPGSYPYQPGLTVSRAISLAGGLTERASEKKIFLITEGGLEADRERVTLDAVVGPGVTITIEQSFF